MPIRIALYEDNAALRDALRILLGGLDQFDLVGDFGNCLNIEDEVRRLDPDVILMDIDMPGRSGIEGAYLAKRVNPATEVPMLTVFDDNDKVFQAVCAGASGYRLKKTPPATTTTRIPSACCNCAPPGIITTPFSRSTTPAWLTRRYCNNCTTPTTLRAISRKYTTKPTSRSFSATNWWNRAAFTNTTHCTGS